MPAKKKSVSSSSLTKVVEKSTSRSRSTSRGRSLGNEKGKKPKASPSPAKKATPKKRASRSPARKQSKERKPSPSRKASPSPKKKSASPETRVSRRDTVETKGDSGRQSARLIEKGDRVVEKQNDTRTTITRTETVSSSVASAAASAKRSYIYGGPIAAFFHILLMPIIIFYLHELIKSPSTLRLVKPDYKNWRKYLDVRTMAISSVWILLHAVFSVLPIGKKVIGLPNRRLVSRYNGFIALMISLSAVILAHYLKCSCLYYVLDHRQAMVVTSIILSIVISTALYLKGRKAPKSTINPEANTGCTPYDFFIGRELHPRLFGIMDLKLFFGGRPGLIGWAVIDLLLILRNYDSTKQVNLILAFIGACHLVYISDFLFFEETFTTTFENNREGFGYMSVMAVLSYLPFFYSIPLIFAVENITQLKLSYPILLAYGLLFLSGYFIYRASNSQKHRFRTDPHHPALSNLRTIYTSGNKSLLAGGWWGLVRHPNYLGDILMSIAMCLPAGLTSALPWIYPIFLVHFLIGRIFRCERECEKKYGSGWKAYTEHVKYRLIPYVF